MARSTATSSSTRSSRFRSGHVQESNFDEWNGNPCDFDLGSQTSQCDGHFDDGDGTSRSTRIRTILDGVNSSLNDYFRSHHRGTNCISPISHFFYHFSTYGCRRTVLLLESTLGSLCQLLPSHNSGSIRQSRSRSFLFRNSISFFRRHGTFPLRSRCHFIDSTRRSSDARRFLSCCSHSISKNQHSSTSSRSFFGCCQCRLIVRLEEESSSSDGPGRIRWRFSFFPSTTNSFSRNFDRHS